MVTLYKRSQATREPAGLYLLKKLKLEHVQLNSYSHMQVDLAAQVRNKGHWQTVSVDSIYDSILHTLSMSVANGLRMYGIEGSSETARFCEMFDRAFDGLNVRHNCGSKKDCQSFKSA